MVSLIAVAFLMLAVGGFVGACLMRRHLIKTADSVNFIHCDGHFYKVYRLDMRRGGVAGDPGEYLKVES
jgi:hypothetical protein